MFTHCFLAVKKQDQIIVAEVGPYWGVELQLLRSASPELEKVEASRLYERFGKGDPGESEVALDELVGLLGTSNGLYYLDNANSTFELLATKEEVERILAR